MSQTSGVSEENATRRLVFVLVPLCTEVAEIVIGEAGEVIEV
jgi:hypothetical protein